MKHDKIVANLVCQGSVKWDSRRIQLKKGLRLWLPI